MTQQTRRHPCFSDGLECSGNEEGRHPGFDPVDLDPTEYPTECGDCDGNPRAEYADYVAHGETCVHGTCADGAYYGALYRAMPHETRDEREERLADTELMIDEFHGRED